MTPHRHAQHLGATWLDPEDSGSRRRARCIVRPNPHHPLPDLPIGALRIVRCGVPDTFSTIPARMVFKGRRLQGYISVDQDARVFIFTPEADPSRCTMCAPGDGCRSEVR